MNLFPNKKEPQGKERESTLFRPPIFKNLNDRDLQLVYSLAKEKECLTGDLIIRQGDPRKSFYLIIEGGAKLYKEISGAQREIARLERGDVIGEIAFIGKNPRTATAFAARRSKLLEFTPEAFDSLPERVQLKIFKRLAEIAEDRLETMISMNCKMTHVESRLAEFIQNSRKTGEGLLASDLVSDVIRNVPKLPIYARDLALKLLDEKVSPKEVAESIKLDPSLASMVLKTVNSAYFGLLHKVSDFSRAVVLLGFTQVYQLVIYQGIHSVMPQSPQFKELQTHSYLMSLMAYEISMQTNREKAGVNSTIGLLSDVGKSVVLLLKRKNPRLAQLIDVLDHAQLGGGLLRSWDLPDHVCDVVQSQSMPEYLPPSKLPEELAESLAILHLAQTSYRLLVGGEDEPESAYFRDYLLFLKFPDMQCERFCKEKLLPSLLKNEARLPSEIKTKLHDIQYGER